MNLNKFFVGRAVGLVILLAIVGIIAGFYALNNYIYKEKQGENIVYEPYAEGENGTPIFEWKFEEADSLNLDGNPEINVFLEAMYPNKVVQRKLIDTVPMGCNTLEDTKEIIALNSSVAQCYGAGLGYWFKVTKGENSYLVERKMFEEASPDYNPPASTYETILEFPLSI